MHVTMHASAHLMILHIIMHFICNVIQNNSNNYNSIHGNNTQSKLTATLNLLSSAFLRKQDEKIKKKKVGVA